MGKCAPHAPGEPLSTGDRVAIVLAAAVVAGLVGLRLIDLLERWLRRDRKEK